MLYTIIPRTSSPIAALVVLEVRSQWQGRNLVTIHLLANVDGAEESDTRVSVVQPEVSNADDVLKQVIMRQFSVQNRHVQVSSKCSQSR